MVVSTLDRTLEALEHQDIELAQIVVNDDDRIDGRYLEVQQGILSLLALQAPVASDLRTVAALLHGIVTGATTATAGGDATTRRRTPRLSLVRAIAPRPIAEASCTRR